MPLLAPVTRARRPERKSEAMAALPGQRVFAARRQGVGGGAVALRSAPVVEDRDALRAVHGAVGRAALAGAELAHEVGPTVLRERHARPAAHLRAVADAPVLVDVQVARAGPTAPGVGPAGRQV